MDSYHDVSACINETLNFASFNHIRITKLERDYCEAELAVVPESLNFMGIVHGGCLATLADTAAGGATRTRGRLCVTLSGNLNYLAPATGSKIRGIARVVRGGRSIVVSEVTLLDEHDVKVATGIYTFYLREQAASHAE